MCPGDVQVIQEPHHILAHLETIALRVMGLVALAVSAVVERDAPHGHFGVRPVSTDTDGANRVRILWVVVALSNIVEG
jgi:hypothetical protein